MLRKVGKKKERKKEQKFDESKDFHSNYIVELLNVVSNLVYSYQQIFCTVLSRVNNMPVLKIVCSKNTCMYI